MHRSMLGTLVIDCQGDDLDGAAQFWSRALGREVVRRHEPGDEKYRGLAGDPREPRVLLQQVAHDSRLHIDIETDDIDAEVERLVALGARDVQRRDEPSDNGNVLMRADFGLIEDPPALARRLQAVAGLVDHGIFPGEMVERVIVAGADGVRELVHD